MAVSSGKSAAAALLRVRVKPNARRASFLRQSDGTWLARVKSPPIQGRANLELIALVAGHFRCAKSAVSIKAGGSGRTKLVRIETVMPAGSS
jgi:uncharacterized protein (TIGR00251 family)